MNQFLIKIHVITRSSRKAFMLIKPWSNDLTIHHNVHSPNNMFGDIGWNLLGSKTSQHFIQHFYCPQIFSEMLDREKSVGTTELHYNTKKWHHVLAILKSFFRPMSVG